MADQGGTYGLKGIGNRALELPSGPDVTVAPPERARIKYDAGTDRLLLSKDGGAYVEIGSGGGGGSPAGADTQIQYNDSGSFGASAALTFDGTDLLVSNSAIVGQVDIATQGSDPPVAAGFASVYVKQDGSGDTQLFSRSDNGTVTQLTPATGGGGQPQYFVGPSGTDADYTTIADALAQANTDFPSDPFTIFLLPDTYAESVAITRDGVSIMGLGEQVTITDSVSFSPSADNSEFLLQGVTVQATVSWSGSAQGAKFTMRDVEVDAGDAIGVSNTIEGNGCEWLIDNCQISANSICLSIEVTGDLQTIVTGGATRIERSDDTADAITISGPTGCVTNFYGPGIIVVGTVDLNPTNVVVNMDGVDVTSGDATATIGVNAAVNTATLNIFRSQIRTTGTVTDAIGGSGNVNYLDVLDFTGSGLAGTLTATDLSASLL